MPKISILIPIYNVASYLEECLDSIVNQTEKNIEIICVEDGSTDNSLQILEKYASTDRRIQIIRHSDNLGLTRTRKDAVDIATGKFCMFVDSDDFLSLDACERLYSEIVQRNVDVLQFNTEVIPNENTSDSMVKWVTNFMKPSVEKVSAENLVNACFLEHKFNCNLWNKIWKTSICKEAYSHIKDGYFVSAEDRYATFVMTFFSKTYAGISDVYYHYRLGVGITGGTKLNLFQFESRCTAASIVNNIREFLQKENRFQDFQEAFFSFREDILEDCVDCWYNKLPETEFYLGYHLLLKYWGEEAVIGVIGKKYFEEQQVIYQKAQSSKRKNIAIYYRYIGYETMNPIINKYLDFFKQESANIIFITDFDAPEHSGEYMNCPLFHIYSATEANWMYYKNRCHDILQILSRELIDEVYYLSPTSHIVKLDELTITSLNKKCIVCMDEFILDRVNKQQEKLSFLESENIKLKKQLDALNNKNFIVKILLKILSLKRTNS